jgi:hypothetical protein
MSYYLTEEQQLISDAFRNTSQNIKVNARAGTGKSFIIRKIVGDNMNKTSLFLLLTLNKDNREEMFRKLKATKDIYRVKKDDIRTFDSFILSLFNKCINRRVDPFKNMSKDEIYPLIEEQYKNFFHKWYSIIMNIIHKFTLSSDNSIQQKHIPSSDDRIFQKRVRSECLGKSNEYFEKKYKKYKHKLLLLAKNIFDICNPITNKNIDKCLFNSMCKYLDLDENYSRVNIEQHTIIVDEAQDISPCFGNILNKINARLMVVGDIDQTINQFRGSDGVYFNNCKFKNFNLTQSFRSNEYICDMANKILSLSGSDNVLRSMVNTPLKNNLAILCRTNQQIFKLADLFIKNNINFKADVNLKMYIALSYIIGNLMKGKKIKNEELREKNITTYKEFLEKLDELDTKWKITNDLIKEKGNIKLFRNYIYELQKKLSNNTDWKILIKTIHRSKGEQYDYVLLAPDCNIVLKNPDNMKDYSQEMDEKKRIREMCNLMYVAITRARIGCDTQFMNCPFQIKSNFNYKNIPELKKINMSYTTLQN